MTFKWVAYLLLLCMLPAAMWAQEPQGILSLEDCIQIALNNNPNIRTNRNLAEISANNYRASYSGILPNIRTSGGLSRFERGNRTAQNIIPVFDSTGTIIGTRNETTIDSGFTSNSYSFNVSVDQTFFDGGNWWNQIRQGKAEKNAALYSMNSQINQTIKTVAQNYLDLLKQLKILDVNRLAVQRSQDNHDKTQRMFEIGSVAKVDVFRAKVTLGNDRIALLNQEIIARQARQTLNIALGFDPGNETMVDENIQFDYSLPAVEGLVQEAMISQPELRRQEMDIRSREFNVGRARSTFLPVISGFFRYNRDANDYDLLFDDFSQQWSTTVGLNISLNLFNGFTDQVNLQNAKISARNAKINLEDYKRTLSSNITRLHDSYKSQGEIITIYKENLEAAREEYRLATERFRLGSGTSLDIREAQVSLTDAERQLVSAEYDLIITYAELQEAVGHIQDAF